MDEIGCEYEVGRGKPPLHSRFKEGQSGGPRAPRAKNLPALLVAALSSLCLPRIRKRDSFYKVFGFNT
jgi:hypothetical protein